MNKNVILSYNKLWKLMVDKNLNKTQLHEKAQIITNAVAKISRNETISLGTLAKVCYALDCGNGDIVEIIIEERRQL